MCLVAQRILHHHLQMNQKVSKRADDNLRKQSTKLNPKKENILKPKIWIKQGANAKWLHFDPIAKSWSDLL